MIYGGVDSEKAEKFLMLGWLGEMCFHGYVMYGTYLLKLYFLDVVFTLRKFEFFKIYSRQEGQWEGARCN